MADEGAEANVEVIEAGAPPPKEKGNSMVMILMVMSVLMMILTPAIVFVLFYQMKPKTEDVKTKSEKLHEVLLPKMTVNVKGTNASRYVEVEVAVLLSEKEWKKYFEKQSDTQPDGKLNRISAKVQEILSDQTLAELSSQEGKARMKRDIMKAISTIINKTDGDIREVYFTRFLISQ